MSLSPEYWEKLLADEGLGVVGSQSFMFSYEEGRCQGVGGQTLGDVILPDKEEDDPVLLAAREEILSIAARLPPRWSVMLQLRARGLTQRAIAARLGVRQPTVAEQLQRVLRVLPALLETRHVTPEEISSFVKLAFPTNITAVNKAGNVQTSWRQRERANVKREKLIASYLRCWGKTHAAHEAGIAQSEAHRTLVVPVARFPDHPVAQVLSVINTTIHIAEGRARGEKTPIMDYFKFL